MTVPMDPPRAPRRPTVLRHEDRERGDEDDTTQRPGARLAFDANGTAHVPGKRVQRLPAAAARQEGRHRHLRGGSRQVGAPAQARANGLFGGERIGEPLPGERVEQEGAKAPDHLGIANGTRRHPRRCRDPGPTATFAPRDAGRDDGPAPLRTEPAIEAELFGTKGARRQVGGGIQIVGAEPKGRAENDLVQYCRAGIHEELAAACGCGDTADVAGIDLTNRDAG